MNILLMGGLPSSGSTLLMYLLSKNGGYLCLPETGLFTQGRVFGSDEQSLNTLHNTVSWINVKAKVQQAIGWDLFNDDNEDHYSPQDIIKSKIGNVGGQIIVEKTPENIFAFNNYLNKDQNHQVITTSRDMESVCFSLMKRKFSMIEALVCWFAHAYEIYCILQKFPHQTLHVAYHDLCTDPDKTIDHITKFYNVKKISKSDLESPNVYDSIDTNQYEWNLNKSSWFLSGRYWSKNVDGSTGAPPKNLKIGTEFNSLVDLILFKTPDNKYIKPKDLDHALQTNSESIFTSSTNGFSAINILSRSNIIQCLLNTYQLHYYDQGK